MATKVALPDTKWVWLNNFQKKTGSTPYMLHGIYTIGMGSKVYAATPPPAAKPQPRIWFSNPRATTDATWEVLTIKMRNPITITDLSFSLFNVGQKFAIYATSANGTTSALVGADLKNIAGTVIGVDPLAGSSLPTAWTNKAFSVRAVNITSLQIRVARTKNAKSPSKLVSLGVRDILIKRTVTTQDDTLYGLSDQVDSMGNAVRYGINDWNPSLAVDSDAYTFWRSSPQPDPAAVVNFYVNVAENGTDSQRVDRFFLDPVYTGNTLNVYYSNDDSLGVFRPLPLKDKSILTAPAKIVLNSGVDLRNGGSYEVKTSQLIAKSGSYDKSTLSIFGWIGLEWDPAANLEGITTIFETTTGFPPTLSLKYDNDNSVFIWQTGTDTILTSSPVTISHGTPVQIVAAVKPPFNTNIEGFGSHQLRLFVSVSGNIISDGLMDVDYPGLEVGFFKLYYNNCTLLFANSSGIIKNLIIKGDSQNDSDYMIFLNDPESVVTPTPPSEIDQFVQTQGRTESTNLDYALFVGPFTSGFDGYGGIDDAQYAEKIWTPIWKDWIAQRGFYYLPNPVSAKYLKFEFSGLTEQPYLVWENGISVSYKKFPTNVLQMSQVSTTAQVNVSATSQTNALQRNNFSGTNTTATFTQQLNRQNATKTQIFVTSQLVTNLRNQLLYDSSILRNESAGSTSLRSSSINDIRDLASGLLQSMIASNSPANDKLVNSTNQDLYDSSTNNTTPTDLTDSTYTTSLAARVPGWWILPGGNLKIPSNVMDEMTKSSTVTERPISNSSINTTRIRFPVSSVHRYEMATAYRDVGLAYFAGIRELQVFRLDYTVPTDSDAYVVTSFDSNVLTSVTGMEPSTVDLPMHPLSVPATVIMLTWPSVSTYQKISISTVDRGWRSLSRGQDLAPAGLGGGPQAFWNDDFATWSDNTARWGSTTALVGLDFESGIYFAGKEATKIFRQPGSGAAGASSAKFSLKANTRIRLKTSLFRPSKASWNTLLIQLEDTTPITGSVLKEFKFDVELNKWTDYASDWFTLGSDYPNLRINFLINSATGYGTPGYLGPVDNSEILYVGDLYEEVTTIVYYVSNDDGANYYEVTEIIGQENSFFIFPTSDNRLKTKIVMYDLNDYTYGMTIVPTYLF